MARLALRSTLACCIFLLLWTSTGAEASQPICVNERVLAMESERFIAGFERLATALDSGPWGVRSNQLLGSPVAGMPLASTASELRALVAHDDPDSRALLCQSFEQMPDLAGAPDLVADVLEASDRLTRGGGRGVCIDPDAAQALLATTFSLEQLLTVAQAQCDGQSCPLYVGLAVCVPTVPGCAIACPLAAAAKAVLNISKFVYSQSDRCLRRQHIDEVAERQEALRQQSEDLFDSLVEDVDDKADVEVSSRASASSLALFSSRLQADLSRLAGGVSAVRAEVAAQEEASQIELALLDALAIESVLQGGAGEPTVGLTLQRSLGGRLEDVRTVVAAAIQMVSAIGEDVTAALALFDAGDQLLNAGAGRAAFAEYRSAYRAIAQEVR